MVLSVSLFFIALGFLKAWLVKTHQRTTGFTKEIDLGWATENVYFTLQSPYLKVKIEGVNKEYYLSNQINNTFSKALIIEDSEKVFHLSNKYETPLKME